MYTNDSMRFVSNLFFELLVRAIVLLLTLYKHGRSHCRYCALADQKNKTKQMEGNISAAFSGTNSLALPAL